MGSILGLLFLSLLTFIDVPIWEVRYVVDMNSGRMAEERLFFHKQVAFESRDTAVSIAAEPSGWISKTPNWFQYRNDSHFSFTVRLSATYNADRQIETASKAWDRGEFSPEAKRESARSFLRSEPWGSYATHIQELADSHPKGGKPVELSDLPSLTQP